MTNIRQGVFYLPVVTLFSHLSDLSLYGEDFLDRQSIGGRHLVPCSIDLKRYEASRFTSFPIS